MSIHPKPAPEPDQPGFPDGTLPIHDALALTGNGQLALIRLGSQVYTLRITRAGKLILTK